MQTDRPAERTELREIHATLDWRGAYESVQQIRGHAFVVDEPAKLGGGDRGPTPLEYTLGAYDGCLQIVIVMIANELGLSVRNVAIASVAAVDRRGLFGTAAVSPHYQRIETTVELEFDEPGTPHGALEALQDQLYARCPMYNLMRDAGVELRLDWRIATRSTG